jgi:transporter family-2 protein
VLVGGLVALQAPINSVLGKAIGTFAAASVSFAIGTTTLVVLTLTVGGGFGDIGQIRNLEWQYLLGGLLGAAYVTTVLVTVRTLGASGTTACVIAGQLASSVVIDRLGVLGLEQKPLSVGRIVGIALLGLGVFLIVRE